MYRFTFLEQTDFPRIIRTFDEAFADYYIKRKNSSAAWLEPRCIKNGVDLQCSVAVLAGERMVGITLIGLDNWQGTPAAFDAATGIIPDFRGKGLARRMFDFAVPKLKERKVEKFILEVLQVNQQAIKAYQKTGFTITREFDCFELRLTPDRPRQSVDAAIEIKEITVDDLDQFKGSVDWAPSWENSFSSIRRAAKDTMMYGAFIDGTRAGELVYYPILNWVISLVVRRTYRRRGIASALVSHLLNTLPAEHESIRVTNVDCSDQAMMLFFRHHGWKSFTRQYEMELVL